MAAHRVAQVALSEVAHVDEQLNGRGLVEAVAAEVTLADFFGGALVEHRQAGVARYGAGQGKGDDQDAESNRQGKRQSSKDKAEQDMIL